MIEKYSSYDKDRRTKLVYNSSSQKPLAKFVPIYFFLSIINKISFRCEFLLISFSLCSENVSLSFELFPFNEKIF